MLSQDLEFSDSQLLSFSTWNIQGKSIAEALVVLDDCLLDFNFIAVQEVSGCSQLCKGCYSVGGQVSVGMTSLYFWPSDCFSPLALAIQCSSAW